MKPENRDYILYLEDILLSLERIREYVSGLDFIRFKQDYKTGDAVIRNFEIIGEAAKNLPAELKESHPEIPSGEMYRLRNRASHEYFGIDYGIIWAIIINHLPVNYQDLKNILDSANSKQ